MSNKKSAWNSINKEYIVLICFIFFGVFALGIHWLGWKLVAIAITMIVTFFAAFGTVVMWSEMHEKEIKEKEKKIAELSSGNKNLEYNLRNARLENNNLEEELQHIRDFVKSLKPETQEALSTIFDEEKEGEEII